MASSKTVHLPYHLITIIIIIILATTLLVPFNNAITNIEATTIGVDTPRSGTGHGGGGGGGGGGRRRSERASGESCDLFAGSWVYDSSYPPAYGSSGCPFVEPEFDCQKYGRPTRSTSSTAGGPPHATSRGKQ
uniref:Trichome birefringence-like N-terminal domain-containing protein n=1 Tax=Ananas comosus var. bracteatus TaxID=296719 RepID=A0A6V7PTU3_ANACO|nr:unnamed protein product [Ananas comosus var. bracteatus]